MSESERKWSKTQLGKDNGITHHHFDAPDKFGFYGIVFPVGHLHSGERAGVAAGTSHILEHVIASSFSDLLSESDQKRKGIVFSAITGLDFTRYSIESRSDHSTEYFLQLIEHLRQLKLEDYYDIFVHESAIVEREGKQSKFWNQGNTLKSYLHKNWMNTHLAEYKQIFGDSDLSVKMTDLEKALQHYWMSGIHLVSAGKYPTEIIDSLRDIDIGYARLPIQQQPIQLHQKHIEARHHQVGADTNMLYMRNWSVGEEGREVFDSYRYGFALDCMHSFDSGVWLDELRRQKQWVYTIPHSTEYIHQLEMARRLRYWEVEVAVPSIVTRGEVVNSYCDALDKLIESFDEDLLNLMIESEIASNEIAEMTVRRRFQSALDMLPGTSEMPVSETIIEELRKITAQDVIDALKHMRDPATAWITPFKD